MEPYTVQILDQPYDIFVLEVSNAVLVLSGRSRRTGLAGVEVDSSV